MTRVLHGVGACSGDRQVRGIAKDLSSKVSIRLVETMIFVP